MPVMLLATEGYDMDKFVKMKVLREKKKVSQEDLAQLSGVSVKTISNIENCKVKPTRNNGIAIAKALGTVPEKLI